VVLEGRLGNLDEGRRWLLRAAATDNADQAAKALENLELLERDLGNRSGAREC
jgi:hypothetical protein